MDRIELAAALIAGFFLDQLLGDPQIPFHPVRLIGNLIQRLERFFYRWPREEKRRLFLGGVLLAVTVCMVTALFVLGVLWVSRRISPILHFFMSVLFCYFFYAVKDLKTESMRVYDALKGGSLKEARTAVSMIVGRDTERLSEAGVVRAAVETVAENTSDGIIAPLFYATLGGPVLAWVYKAVNTMDSMVGYKNETYLYFGRAAARLDDLVNYIPSRLSAVLMILASFFCRLDGKQAVKIYRRDRRKHASPNSAQTEAVCAGALGVQLAGDAWYFGVLHKKPVIGDDLRPVEPEDIPRANRLMFGTSVLGLLLAAAFQFFMSGFGR